MSNKDRSTRKKDFGGIQLWELQIHNNRFTQNTAALNESVFMATNIAFANLSYNVFEGNQAMSGSALYFSHVTGGQFESLGDCWSENNCSDVDCAVIDLGANVVNATFRGPTWYSETQTNQYLSIPAGNATLYNLVVQMPEGFRLLTTYNYLTVWIFCRASWNFV